MATFARMPGGGQSSAYHADLLSALCHPIHPSTPAAPGSTAHGPSADAHSATTTSAAISLHVAPIIAATAPSRIQSVPASARSGCSLLVSVSGVGCPTRRLPHHPPGVPPETAWMTDASWRGAKCVDVYDPDFRAIRVRGRHFPAGRRGVRRVGEHVRVFRFVASADRRSFTAVHRRRHRSASVPCGL